MQHCNLYQCFYSPKSERQPALLDVLDIHLDQSAGQPLQLTLILGFIKRVKDLENRLADALIQLN
jgi:hypothetical protein